MLFNLKTKICPTFKPEWHMIIKRYSQISMKHICMMISMGARNVDVLEENYLFIYELALTYIDQAVMLTNPKRRKNINKMRKDKKQNLDKEEKEKKTSSPLSLFSFYRHKCILYHVKTS